MIANVSYISPNNKMAKRQRGTSCSLKYSRKTGLAKIQYLPGK
jgi:hypothetical protein